MNLTLKIAAFISFVLLMVVLGLYPKEAIDDQMDYSGESIVSDSTSIEVDSVCFQQSGYDFCYKIFDRRYYYLVISKQNKFIDSIKLDPFVWDNIGKVDVFPMTSSPKKYVLEINQQFMLVLVPLNLGSALLIPVNLSNANIIEKSKVHWLLTEGSFFIYDKKDKIIANRVERGEEYGRVVLWRYENGKLRRLKKVDIQSLYVYPPTESYINEVINIING